MLFLEHLFNTYLKNYLHANLIIKIINNNCVHNKKKTFYTTNFLLKATINIVRRRCATQGRAQDFRRGGALTFVFVFLVPNPKFLMSHLISSLLDQGAKKVMCGAQKIQIDQVGSRKIRCGAKDFRLGAKIRVTCGGRGREGKMAPPNFTPLHALWRSIIHSNVNNTKNRGENLQTMS